MDSRPRKTTLETFNEELAILDRPLENDVEFEDERPQRRRRWPALSAFVITGVLFAGGGVLFLSHPDPETIIAAAQAAAATAPLPQPPAAPAGAAAAVTTVEVPAPPPEPTAAMEPASEPPTWRQPPPRKEWTKLRLRPSARPTR